MMKVSDDALRECFEKQDNEYAKKETIEKILKEVRETRRKRRRMMLNVIVGIAMIFTGIGAMMAMSVIYPPTVDRFYFQAVLLAFVFISSMRWVDDLKLSRKVDGHKDDRE